MMGKNTDFAKIEPENRVMQMGLSEMGHLGCDRR
jgi:hypothetical protein